MNLTLHHHRRKVERLHHTTDNLRILLKYLNRVRDSNPEGVPRNLIAQKTGIARSTVFDTLHSLKIRGIVTSQKYKRFPGRGRAQILWSLSEWLDLEDIFAVLEIHHY